MRDSLEWLGRGGLLRRAAERFNFGRELTEEEARELSYYESLRIDESEQKPDSGQAA